MAALMLAAAWTGLAALLAIALVRADRDARFRYLMETQVCHTPSPTASPVTAVAGLRKPVR